MLTSTSGITDSHNSWDDFKEYTHTHTLQSLLQNESKHLKNYIKCISREERQY